MVILEDLGATEYSKKYDLPYDYKDDIFSQLLEEDRVEFEIENNYYCLLTCAHNCKIYWLRHIASFINGVYPWKDKG